MGLSATLQSFVLLLAVAYFILVERHLLGLSQLRLGPAKSGFGGLAQPLFDAVKLLQKPRSVLRFTMPVYFWASPLVFFGILFSLGSVSYSGSTPWGGDTVYLFFLCVLGVSSYPVFFTGFSSGSKYSYISSLRSGAQSVSYEVLFFFGVGSLMFLSSGYCCEYPLGVLSLLWVPLFLLLVLAETARAPFDFTEAESELVSGHNLEYGGVPFIFLFLSEYGVLVLLCLSFSSWFVSWSGCSVLLFSSFFSCFLLLCRGAFPRYRYDTIISLFWLLLLPISMHLLFFAYLSSV